MPDAVQRNVQHQSDDINIQQLEQRPREVQFDWAGVPLCWIPGEPAASHIINVAHLLLPEGERWFVATFKRALPLLLDEPLREKTIGFIGQEASHAEAHQTVLDHFRESGLDPAPYVKQMEWLFRRLLGERVGLSPAQERELLVEHIAIIAAIEHLTAFLGNWILNARTLDEAGGDPVMLDLLRWHSAEEVEHRTIAFDVLAYFDQGYVRRARAMGVAGLGMAWLWIRGARFLVAADQETATHRKLTWRSYIRAARHSIVPTPQAVSLSIARYLRFGFHPSQVHSTRQAVAYLASSPAARAAAR